MQIEAGVIELEVIYVSRETVIIIILSPGHWTLLLVGLLYESRARVSMSLVPTMVWL